MCNVPAAVTWCEVIRCDICGVAWHGVAYMALRVAYAMETTGVWYMVYRMTWLGMYRVEVTDIHCGTPPPSVTFMREGEGLDKDEEYLQVITNYLNHGFIIITAQKRNVVL